MENIKLFENEELVKKSGVYFLPTVKGLYKIGCSKDIQSRIKQVSSGAMYSIRKEDWLVDKCLVLYCDNCYKVEKEVHKLFADKHFGLELYQLTEQEIKEANYESILIKVTKEIEHTKKQIECFEKALGIDKISRSKEIIRGYDAIERTLELVYDYLNDCTEEKVNVGDLVNCISNFAIVSLFPLFYIKKNTLDEIYFIYAGIMNTIPKHYGIEATGLTPSDLVDSFRVVEETYFNAGVISCKLIHTLIL